MFKALGWEAPKYAHLPVIMKLDHGNKRKLSKRKDPEAASATSWKVVIRQKLIVYLMSSPIPTSRSGRSPIRSRYLAFQVRPRQDVARWRLFDIDKLNYFSKEYIAKEPAKVLAPKVLAWAEKYNENFRIKILSDEPYFEKILNIEKERPNPRKDYAKYSDIEPLTRFFYEDDYKEITLTRFRSIRVMTRTRSALCSRISPSRCRMASMRPPGGKA
jgi:glutamyl-tRNA synthetase